jgi:isoquinoline 1-oxidoreductase subunit alpha
MPTQTFILNGQQVNADCEDSVRLLWVLRDLLGIHGPKYGCGLDVCKACTCHYNGEAFNPCAVQVGDIQPTDQITTIEGLPASAGLPEGQLHPMQEAWLQYDVGQCGYCQPGQIMAAVALVKEKGAGITEDDIAELQNICRCGTYPRIREAILAGAAGTASLPA